MVLVYQNGKFFATKKRASSPSIEYLKEFKNATKIWANGLSISEWNIFATKKRAYSLRIAGIFLLPKKGQIVLAQNFQRNLKTLPKFGEMVLVYQNGKFFATKKRANGPRVAYLKESKNATKIWANGLSISEWKNFCYQKKGKYFQHGIFKEKISKRYQNLGKCAYQCFILGVLADWGCSRLGWLALT